MVIGPTPPGTGVTRQLPGADVAGHALRGAVDADVDVLADRDPVDQRGRVEVGGERRLEQGAVHGGVGGQLDPYGHVSRPWRKSASHSEVARNPPKG